jgi:hypothetical protein
MSTTYLGFFMNRQTKEEFVAPVMAQNADTAKWELEIAYPTSRYQLLTVYSRTELENVLIGIDRWPGLPSKVQAPVMTDLSKVKASMGGLPPLPGQKVEQLVAQLPDNQPSMPAWMRDFMTNSKIAQKPAVPLAPALEQAMSQRISSTQNGAAPQMVQQSLIERLKAVKGESMPIRREATPLKDTPISRGASGASVIDILKGMRK